MATKPPRIKPFPKEDLSYIAKLHLPLPGKVLELMLRSHVSVGDGWGRFRFGLGTLWSC